MNFPVGATVRHCVGQHERTVEVDYFDSKDNRETFGGRVVDSTEPINATPDRGWGYTGTVIEVLDS